MQSRVRDVLLQGVQSPGELRLKTFVKDHLDMDLPETIPNPRMEAFFESPLDYIDDKKLCNRIVSLPSYTLLKAKFKKAMEVAMELQETADYLESLGIIDLQQWKEYANKDTLLISAHAKGLLDGALAGVSQLLPQVQLVKHFYDTVSSAQWHYIEMDPNSGGIGMRVKEGLPEELWSDAEVNDYQEYEGQEIEGQPYIEAPQVPLMVLSSEGGWPYTYFDQNAKNDCFVRREMVRVWRIIQKDIAKWVKGGCTSVSATQRILIGTPGIGKSFGGSYLLYELLRCDVQTVPVVAYFIDRLTYIFDKTTKRVTVYNDVKGLAMVDKLAHNYKGYTIYDCSAEKVEPPLSLPMSWGTVLISPPSEKHFKNWEKQKTASRFFMNCPEENDIKAMCAWRKRRKPDELQDYWIMIKDRLSHVGPVLRYIFDEGMYTIRSLAARRALATITPSTAELCYGAYRYRLWLNANPLQAIVKIVRMEDRNGVETFYNDPICPEVRDELRNSLGESIDSSEVLMTLLLPTDALISRALNVFGLKVFTELNFTLRIHKCLEEIRPPWVRRPQSCVLRDDVFARPTDQEEIPYEIDSNRRMKLQFERLYKPSNPNFPVVDAFFFVREPRKTIVGIQTNASKYRHTTTSKVKALHDHLATLFMDWEEISKDLSWEIIYAQHTAKKTKLTWRRCDVVVPKGQKNVKEVKDEHEAIAKHWNEKVHQYQL